MLRVLTAFTVLALFATACGSDGGDATTIPSAAPTSTSAPAPSTTSSSTSVEVAQEPGTTVATESPEPTTTTLPGATLLEVVVVEGEVAEIGATLGDEVRLTVYSDESDEVHLHTYDIHADVAPGSPAVIEFVASIPGIFEVEFEGAGWLIAELRVDP